MSKWEVVATENARRISAQQLGTQGSWSGFLKSIDPIKEEAKILAAGGGSTVRVLHPYIGTNSWIRVMPNRFSGVQLKMLADSKQTYLANYDNSNTREKRTQAYLNGTDLYRVLQEGEIQILSSGKAGSFWSKDGRASTHAGPLYGHLSLPDMEWMMKAPTHQFRGMHYNSDRIGDELRFGLVKRGFPRSAPIKTNSQWAKEFLVSLKNKENEVACLQMGDVVDKEGNAESGFMTGIPLRYKMELLMSNLTKFRQEIDRIGNQLIILPDSATLMMLSAPNAVYRVHSKDVELMTLNNSKQVAGNAMYLFCGTDMALSAPKTLGMVSPSMSLIGTVLNPALTAPLGGLKLPAAIASSGFAVKGHKDIQIGTALGAELAAYQPTQNVVMTSTHTMHLYNTQLNPLDPYTLIGNPALASFWTPTVRYDSLQQAMNYISTIFQDLIDFANEHVHEFYVVGGAAYSMQTSKSTIALPSGVFVVPVAAPWITVQPPPNTYAVGAQTAQTTLQTTLIGPGAYQSMCVKIK